MAKLDASHFYEHSGRTGLSVPMMLLGGIPTSIFLAIVYAYIVVYCPVVGYVNVLFLGGYVFGTGLVAGWLAKTGKSRNALVSFLIGCLIGLIGLYSSWVFFFKALATFAEVEGGVPALGLALSPGTLWEMIVEVNKEGWWGPSGMFQWILCAIEAVVFVIGVGLLACGPIHREVFCEACGSWCEPSAERHLQFTEEYAKSLEGQDADFDHTAILKLPEATEQDLPRFTAEILECTGCKSTTAVRLKLLHPKVGKDNEVEIETTDIDGILLQTTTV